MKLEDRIKAATIELQQPGISTPQLKAWAMIRAAFPELFTTPPQAWIAPWEVTEDMANEMECQFSTETQWSAARDAHLSQPEGQGS